MMGVSMVVAGGISGAVIVNQFLRPGHMNNSKKKKQKTKPTV